MISNSSISLNEKWCIDNTELNKKMRLISKENYDYIIDKRDEFKDVHYCSDIFELEQNFFIRQITGIKNEHDLAIGKMISHGFMINRKHNILKLDLNYIQEITMESKLENPKLRNFEGRMKIILTTKQISYFAIVFANYFCKILIHV